MKTLARIPTWIRKKYEAIRKNLPTENRRPQEDTGKTTERCETKTRRIW